MGILDGKRLVIIGGSTGMGFSAAKRCVEEGARIVIVGRNPESALRAVQEIGGDACLAVTGDAIESRTSEEAIETCLAKWGGFDGLYHVAGGSGRRMGDGPLHEVTDEGIQATLELNLHSIIKSNRAAIRAFMDRQQGGTILNMSSVLGAFPSREYFATHVYAASKAAVFGFTRSLASYYAPYNIRINTIAPALVETPMAQRAAEDDTIQHFIRTKQPLDGGRTGIAEDLDGAVVYFLSDLSRFTTGQTLAVDGGWSVSEGQIPR